MLHMAHTPCLCCLSRTSCMGLYFLSESAASAAGADMTVIVVIAGVCKKLAVTGHCFSFNITDQKTLHKGIHYNILVSLSSS